jgi:hypothetical protein
VLDLCWEVEANGDRMNREPCTLLGATAFPWDDAASPFAGTGRELFLGQTANANEGGSTAWYTDPYSANGQAAPFPGSVRQFVATVDTTGDPPLQRRLSGGGTDLREPSVHAPN